ncbi:MAG: MerR family transcriptional regulator [Hyphomonas sp.]|nr:MerR family transcriptional regulator [Hyphomonas sp.]
MSASRARVEKSATAFRSIGEAASELGVETHVIRYWESKFPKEVRPVKRADGRRLFRPKDVDALRAIQILVHDNGMTLKGAKALIAEQGLEAVLSGAATLGAGAPAGTSPARELQASVAKAFGALQDGEGLTDERRGKLEGALGELTDIKARIDAALARRAA